MTFSGAAAGTGTLVLVNRPGGDPPLQTFAMPVYVKAPAAAGHPPAQPQRRQREPRGQGRRHHPGHACRTSRRPTSSGSSRSPTPRSSSRSASRSSSRTATRSAPRARWCGRSGGRRGQDPADRRLQVRARRRDAHQDVAGQHRRQAGLHAQDRGRASTIPGRQVHVQPGDRSSPAEQQRRHVGQPATTKQLTASKPVRQGRNDIVTYKAKAPRRGDPGAGRRAAAAAAGPGVRVLGHRRQGQAPMTVHRQPSVTWPRPSTVSAGEPFDIACRATRRPPAISLDRQQRHPRRRGRAAGRPDARRRRRDMPGAPGTTVCTSRPWRPVRRQLVLLEQPPGDGGTPGAHLHDHGERAVATEPPPGGRGGAAGASRPPRSRTRRRRRGRGWAGG